MKISRITLVILSINSLIDQDQSIEVQDVFKRIEDHSILDFLISKFGELEDCTLDGIELLNKSQDKKELLGALDRLANTVTSEDLGIKNRNNGLLFLSALLNELIQSNVEDINFK